MPIHLLWGDDSAAIEREVDHLIHKIVDPAWISINLSRLDGSDLNQASQALVESRTPPFGNGGRLVLVKRSPFCNTCSNELARFFEEVLELIPNKTTLILINSNKPDGRLRTTKALQILIKQKKAIEKSFLLPTAWDEKGQQKLVERTSQEMGLTLSEKATSLLVKAIGNNSARLTSELKKLALLADTNENNKNDNKKIIFISEETVKALIDGITTNALQVGESLLSSDIGEAISMINALLEQGEPPLRIIATLTNQARGWLWVSLMEQQGERDVAKIAKAAGIANPKRIYIMRKQIKGIPAKRFLKLLGCLLEIEAGLKKGVTPLNAFKDGLLTYEHFK